MAALLEPRSSVITNQRSPDDLGDHTLDAVLTGLEDEGHHAGWGATTGRQLTDIDPAPAAPAETIEGLAGH